jgi:predicted nucleic acid-binding protein
MNAIDTNIWIYRHDGRDPVKQLIAEQLATTVNPQILLWQIGSEFIAASRKLTPFGFTEDKAWAALADMQRVANSIEYPNANVWVTAQDLQKRYSLAFWDALLIAACILAGVRNLYTENMGSPRTIDGVSLINPFATGP